jgi:hypothetical protein
MYIERERECKCKIVYPWRTHRASLYNPWLMDSLNTSPTLSKNPKWNPHTHTHRDGGREGRWLSNSLLNISTTISFSEPSTMGRRISIHLLTNRFFFSKKKRKIVLTFLRRFQIQLIVKRKGGTSCSIDAFDICDVIKTPLSDETCR